METIDEEGSASAVEDEQEDALLQSITMRAAGMHVEDASKCGITRGSERDLGNGGCALLPSQMLEAFVEDGAVPLEIADRLRACIQGSERVTFALAALKQAAPATPPPLARRTRRMCSTTPPIVMRGWELLHEHMQYELEMFQLLSELLQEKAANREVLRVIRVLREQLCATGE